MLLKTDNLIEMTKEDSLFPRNGYSYATWLENPYYHGRAFCQLACYFTEGKTRKGKKTRSLQERPPASAHHLLLFLSWRLVQFLPPTIYKRPPFFGLLTFCQPFLGTVCGNRSTNQSAIRSK